MKQDTLEGKAKTKNGIKRLCFSIICILLEVIFIITIAVSYTHLALHYNSFVPYQWHDSRPLVHPVRNVRIPPVSPEIRHSPTVAFSHRCSK